MTNSNTPAVFNFNDDIQVRTFLDENQNPWFLAKDICAVLGYKNDSDAIKKHCKEHGVAKRDLIDNLNRKQKASYINEGNLYRLIVKSRKPEAEAFEIWVMEEVLPAIRKTGTYTAEKAKTSKSTADDRTPLRDAINLLVSKKHILYPEAYSYVHQRFNVKHIDELKPSEITTAVEYVHKLALVGELLEAEQPEPKKALNYDRLVPFSTSKRYLVRVFVSDNVMRNRVFFTGEADTFNDMATGICKTLGFQPVEFRAYPINIDNISVL
ncbi:BRO-N domain-containing protein [Thorsellia kenyensis]|uniref:Bro-N domain-containing protein n=1 Tax=Thorsellia kenyensis TaxID=1549888 RepID=A0ABV6C7T9_9GAMM